MAHCLETESRDSGRVAETMLHAGMSGTLTLATTSKAERSHLRRRVTGRRGRGRSARARCLLVWRSRATWLGTRPASYLALFVPCCLLRRFEASHYVATFLLPSPISTSSQPLQHQRWPSRRRNQIQQRYPRLSVCCNTRLVDGTSILATTCHATLSTCVLCLTGIVSCSVLALLLLARDITLLVRYCHGLRRLRQACSRAQIPLVWLIISLIIFVCTYYFARCLYIPLSFPVCSLCVCVCVFTVTGILSIGFIVIQV